MGLKFNLFLFSLLFSVLGLAQNVVDCWKIDSVPKVSETKGDFGGTLDFNGQFASSIAPIGDIDGDGVMDLIVGNIYDNTSGPKSGACWILFMNNNFTVKNEQKINSVSGGFGGVLNSNDHFGHRVDAMGDLDGDGITDVVVTSSNRNTGGSNKGSFWILLLNATGTVKSELEIGEGLGGFTGTFDVDDNFGSGVSNIGDLNNDGIPDLAVGAKGDDDGGADKGAVYILFMNAAGGASSFQKISETSGGLGALPNGCAFGSSVAGLGDMNNDGVEDIVVGAPLDDDGGTDRGAAWVLFMNTNGTVASRQKISDTQGNFVYGLNDGDQMGYTVSSGYDLDGDGVNEIITGSPYGDDAGTDKGEAYVFFMQNNGTVSEYLAVSQTQGGFNTVLDNFDIFGSSSSPLGDIDGDGFIDVAIGAQQDDNNGVDKGAFYILLLDTTPPILTTSADTTICVADPVQLFVSGADSYVWSPGDSLDDSTIANPVIITSISTTLTVQGTDQFGCVGEAQVLVSYNDQSNIYPIDTTMCFGDFLTTDSVPGATGYLWNTGATTPSIEITAEGYYSVTISLPGSCTAYGETNVTFANPKVDLGGDTLICDYDFTTLTAWPNTSQSVIWNTGQTSPSIIASDSGTYWAQVGDPGCSGSDTVYVGYYPEIYPEWGKSVGMCQNDPIVLEGTIPFANYIWNGTVESPVFQISDTGLVSVRVYNVCEELTQDILIYDWNCECEVYIPNAFSPTADGNNDLFIPQLNCYFEYYKFEIFDRWGNQVFYTESQDEGWDGSSNGIDLNQGIYVWRLEKSFENNIGVTVETGIVHLIRR